MADPVQPSLPPILPVGTAVVVLVEVRGGTGRVAHPRGSAGLITSAPADPEHAYRVRFPGGDEFSLARRELQVLSHFQSLSSAHRSDPLTGQDLSAHIVYRCVVGSRAFGLDRDESDTDRRGIYIPPASMHWSIYGVPEQLEAPDTEEVYWEIGKFIRLALKGNPNILETLYTPIVEHADPLVAELLASRSCFLSRLIFQTFSGYAMSQFEKFSRVRGRGGTPNWKHAMHLIRLLRSGIAALRTGELPLRVDSDREELLAIRAGLVAWKRVDELRRALHAEFEQQHTRSILPERPDYERANRLLIDARRSMAQRENAK